MVTLINPRCTGTHEWCPMLTGCPYCEEDTREERDPDAERDAWQDREPRNIDWKDPEFDEDPAP